MKSLDLAFTEDRLMIEAQQKIIARQGLQSVAIRHDVGPVLMRRVMVELAAAESRP